MARGGWLAVLFPLLLLVLVSCGRPLRPFPPAPRLLVLADRTWWDAAGGDAALRRPLAVASLRHWLLPKFVEVPYQEDARQLLGSLLASGGWKAVVVGPLVAAGAEPLARRFPSVRFIFVGGSAAADVPDNAVLLTFDRRPAFAEAGSEAARVGPVAVVASTARPATPELEAFVAAAREASGAEPAVVTLEEPVDPARLRAAVKELRDQGVQVFLPWLGGGIAGFLDALAELGGVAVVEDWAPFRVRPQEVLLSIDDDLVGGIASCLGPIGAGARVVQGRVTVTRGEADR